MRPIQVSASVLSADFGNLLDASQKAIEAGVDMLHMDVMDGAARDFDATLVLQRRPLTGANLARVLLRFPTMTLRVVAAIHWQAFLIFLRRNPVYSHPKSKAS